MAELDMNDFLAHHGIKGQKWGVKNGPPYPLEDKEELKRRKSDYKRRRTLTNAELESRVRRYKLEKEYRELAAEDFAPGEAYAKSILKDVGKRALTTIIVGATLYGAKAYVTKHFDVVEFGNALFNGGPKKK